MKSMNSCFLASESAINRLASASSHGFTACWQATFSEKAEPIRLRSLS